jgi:hypothetical protein
MAGNGEIHAAPAHLSGAERDRYAALAARAAEAERIARETEAARLEAYREFQRRSLEAGCARSLHREAAARADHAKDDAREAREEWRRAIAEACRSWGRDHIGAGKQAWQQFVAQLAETCGVAPRDLLRLIGYQFDHRTPAELEEDFRRYKAGESVRSIARRRGLRVSAIQKSIQKRLTDEAMAAMQATDPPAWGRPPAFIPQGGRPPCSKNPGGHPARDMDERRSCSDGQPPHERH